MTLFAKKKPPEPAAADEQKISLALTPDEIDLLRECMKRTEDYYRGLLLLKQPVNIPYTVLVQPVEGLVQDQRGGVFHDGLGDAQPLPHSQRKILHLFPACFA